MEDIQIMSTLLFAVALTIRSKPSEYNEATVSWNPQNHRLQLCDTALSAAQQQLCVTELVKLRRPLIETLAAELPPDSIERQLLAIALQGRPDALVRFAEIFSPSEEVCIEAGGTSQGEGGESVCSVCGQELAEFDQDLREAALEDEWADLAFEMEREEQGGDHAE